MTTTCNSEVRQDSYERWHGGDNILTKLKDNAEIILHELRNFNFMLGHWDS